MTRSTHVYRAVARALARTLWLEHGQVLGSLGFEAPSRMAWIRAARRLTGALWLRGPGFFEARNGMQEQRLRLARHILGAVERRIVPPPIPLTPKSPHLTEARSYYCSDYKILAAEAAVLRDRARRLDEADCGSGVCVVRQLQTGSADL